MSNKNKLTALFVTIILIISQLAIFPTASAVEITRYDTDTRAVDYLSLLGIIGKDEVEEYMSDNPISKGEATYLIIKSIGLIDLVDQLGFCTRFSDLTPEQQYSEVVSVAVNQGILVGNDDTTVTLGNPITIAQAAKMLVAALGWETPAQEVGGYPTGHLIIAGRIGILKNISVDADTPITKKIFTRMLYNSFSANLFNYSYESDETLEDKFLDANDLTIHEGVLEATEETSLFDNEKLSEGYAIVGGVRLRTNDETLGDYIGYSIQYISNTETDEMLRYCISNKNVVTRIDRNEYPTYDNGRISYENVENGRQSYISLSNSDVVYLYNKRRLSVVTAEKLDFTDVDVTLIDNDNDDEVEIVKWEKSKSEVVSGINEIIELIHLEEGTSGLGNSIDLDDNGGDKKIIVRDMDGTAVDWHDLKAGDAVSVIESEDGMYLEIILLPEPIMGVVSEIEGEESVVINGETYDILSQLTGIEVGKRGKFYLNESNAVFKVDYDVSEYVYIIKKAGAGSKISNEMQIKVYDNFTGLHVYNVSENLRVDGVRVTGSDLYDMIPTDVVANITVDSDNIVREIETAAKYGGEAKRMYCEFASAFNKGEIGGANSGVAAEPFKFNEDTLFFTVPESGEDEDFGAVISFKDDTEYTTQAYELDPDTECVKAVVVKYSEEDFTTTNDPDYGIVTKVTNALGGDNNDQVRYYVQGYTNGEEFKYAVDDASNAVSVAASLQEGDVISFQKNYSDEIIQMERLISLKTQKDPIALASGERGSFYGTAMFLRKAVITNDIKYLQHELNVSPTGSYGDMATMHICAHVTNTDDEDYQFNNYYIYDRTQKMIAPATIDDVVPYNKSTTSPSTVYLYNGEQNIITNTKILVLVKD